MSSALAVLLVLMLARKLGREDGDGIALPPAQTSGPRDAAARPGGSSSVTAPEVSQRGSIVDYRIIEVVDPEGLPIATATVLLCDRIERIVRSSERRVLGETGLDGRIRVPAEALLARPNAHVAARARGFLPASLAVAETGSGDIRLTLAPEARQTVRCLDLHDEPVEGIVVMLSRLGIPLTFCADGLDPDVEQGLDPTYAMLARETTETGIAEFGELRRGRYQVQIQSEFYEQVASPGSGHWIEVPEASFEIRVTPMLCGVIQVVGDEMYTYSVTTNADDWLSESGFTRSLDALRRRLIDRYPNSLVYACGHPSATSQRTSVTAELLLARTGKRTVELPLAPAYTDPRPLVVDVESGTSGVETISTVTFRIRDSLGRSVDGPDLLQAYREKSVLPISRRVEPGRPVRLPFGRWSVTTRKDILKKHFQPEAFELSSPEETVELQLDIELVPVRIVALGHRGQAQNGGLLRFTQYGMNDSVGTMDLDALTLWLRPGDTDWYFGTDFFYDPIRKSVPVRSLPEGEVQTIQFDLVLGKGR